MKVKIIDVRKRLQHSLLKKGFSKEEAKIVASEYIEGELQGKPSHGLMAFPPLLQKLSGKLISPKILKKTHSMIYVDAQENSGYLVFGTIFSEALKMAKNEGVALILIKDMTTWLRPGAIAQQIAEKGMIGLVFNNGGPPMTAPPGGYDPVRV